MPGPATLASHSAADLHRELVRRQRSTGGLAKKRDRLLAKIAKLDARIREMGGEIGNALKGRRGSGGAKRGDTGRKRPQNETTLPEAMAKVLKGKTMGVSEVADAVQKAGYKSNAANFKVMVNMNLTKHPKLFKRVERGQYTAK